VLSDEERREIEAAARGLPHRRAACVEALRIVQRHRGWVSDEIHDIAAALEMDPAELDGIATFYSLIFRKPVGRHVILVCDSVTCWILGGEDLRAHLERRLGIGLGQTTDDGLFTLLPAACLGACERAPAMLIDEELLTDLTAARIDEALERYRQ
jgi:NADH-quinone oxidoreductase subunit E